MGIHFSNVDQFGGESQPFVTLLGEGKVAWPSSSVVSHMKMVLKPIVGVRLQGNEEWKLSQNNMHLCFPVVKRQFGPLFDICNLTLTWTDPNWAWGGYHGYETWSYVSNTKKSLHMYAGSVPAQVIRSGFSKLHSRVLDAHEWLDQVPTWMVWTWLLTSSAYLSGE